MRDEEAAILLARGIDQIGLISDKNKIARLVNYTKLLVKWNGVFNLTAIENNEDILRRHIFDALSVLPVLEKENIKQLADVGSGAGIPGIPLGIMHPEWQVFLIEGREKKASFLQQAKAELGLENIIVLGQRTEKITHKFDTLICRAVAPLSDLVRLLSPICTPRAVIWAMKGRAYPEELRGLAKPYKVCATHELQVPGQSVPGYLLKIVKG